MSFCDLELQINQQILTSNTNISQMAKLTKAIVVSRKEVYNLNLSNLSSRIVHAISKKHKVHVNPTLLAKVMIG